MVRPIGTGKYKTGKVVEPTYEATHPERVLELMTEGALDCQIAAKFGIAERTLSRWKDDHEEFKEAYAIGFPRCEAWWIEWGMKGMRGEVKGFNFNSWIAFMNNKFKWSKGTYGDNAQNVTNVSIQNMQVLQNKGIEGLKDYILRIGNKNSDATDIQFEDVIDGATDQITISGSNDSTNNQSE